MPKTFTAQTVSAINNIQFVHEAGVLTQLLCTAEVNYGEIGLTHQVDIFPDLLPAQIERAQAVYDFIKGKVEASFLV